MLGFLFGVLLVVCLGFFLWWVSNHRPIGVSGLFGLRGMSCSPFLLESVIPPFVLPFVGLFSATMMVSVSVLSSFSSSSLFSPSISFRLFLDLSLFSPCVLWVGGGSVSSDWAQFVSRS